MFGKEAGLPPDASALVGERDAEGGNLRGGRRTPTRGAPRGRRANPRPALSASRRICRRGERTKRRALSEHRAGPTNAQRTAWRWRTSLDGPARRATARQTCGRNGYHSPSLMRCGGYPGLERAGIHGRHRRAMGRRLVAVLRHESDAKRLLCGGNRGVRSWWKGNGGMGGYGWQTCRTATETSFPPSI